MKIRHDTIVVIISTLLMSGFIYKDIKLLRIIIGIPYLLFLPGYLILKVLSLYDELKDEYKLGLSVGVSILILSLISLGLNYTLWGLQKNTVYIFLMSIIMSLVLFNHWKQRHTYSDGNAQLIENAKNFWNNINVIQKITIYISLMAIIIIFSLLFYRITTIRSGEKFTEFYILDVNGKLDSSLLVIKPNQQAHFRFGISNNEEKTMNYRLEILISDQIVYSSAGIEIPAKKIYEKLIDLTLPSNIKDGDKVIYYLYINDEMKPYRTLTSWVIIK